MKIDKEILIGIIFVAGLGFLDKQLLGVNVGGH